MAHNANRITGSRTAARRNGVHADEDVVLCRIHRTKPSLKAIALERGRRSHTLGDAAALVRFQKYRDPVLRFESRPQEPNRTSTIYSGHMQRCDGGAAVCPPFSMNARFAGNLSDGAHLAHKWWDSDQASSSRQRTRALRRSTLEATVSSLRLSGNPSDWLFSASDAGKNEMW